jgi:hypothetical protein
MTAKEIFNLAIEMGIAHDPRGGREIKQIFKRNREEYKKLPKKSS